MNRKTSPKKAVSRRGFITGVTVGSVGAVVGREAIAQEFIETGLTLDDLSGEWWLNDDLGTGTTTTTPTEPLPPIDPPTDPQPPATETVSIRRDIYTLPESGQTIQSMRRGIAEMRRRSAVDPSDPTGWNFQATVHGGQTGRGIESCQHNNRFFLGWHRMYLYYFERILRQASGDPTLTLPYWDYSIPGRASLPGVTRFPADTNQNPLYWSDRNPFYNNGGSLPSNITETETTLRAFDYDRFNSLLEQTPHNGVHGMIGGSMASFQRAGLDPVFWLHHCNVDRQWNRWLARGGSHSNPTDLGFLSQSFSFFDENRRQVRISGEDILNTQSLGYRYDDDPADLSNFLVASADTSSTSSPVFIESLDGSGGPQVAMAMVAAPPPAAPSSLLRRASVTLAEAAPGIRLGGGKTKVALRVAVPNAPTPQAVVAPSAIESVDGAPVAAMVLAPPPPVSTAEMFTTATNTAETSGVALQLQDIAFEESPGVFNIFVNLPIDATPDTRGPYYAGYFAPFAQNQSEEPESFDITALLNRQVARGLWDGDEIDVQFIAIDAAGEVTNVVRDPIDIGQIRIIRE